MTKKELVRELESYGEVWANESYSKEYLQKYLSEIKLARSMSLEDLLSHIKNK